MVNRFLFFPFTTLNRSSHCLLVSMFLDEDWLLILLRFPYIMVSCFCLGTFKIFFLMLSSYSLIIICLSMDLFEFMLFGVH